MDPRAISVLNGTRTRKKRHRILLTPIRFGHVLGTVTMAALLATLEGWKWGRPLR
jgi:hypothetical protein